MCFSKRVKKNKALTAFSHWENSNIWEWFEVALISYFHTAHLAKIYRLRTKQLLYTAYACVIQLVLIIGSTWENLKTPQTFIWAIKYCWASQFLYPRPAGPTNWKCVLTDFIRVGKERTAYNIRSRLVLLFYIDVRVFNKINHWLSKNLNICNTLQQKNHVYTAFNFNVMYGPSLL